jgi:hypothetical protein
MGETLIIHPGTVLREGRQHDLHPEEAAMWTGEVWSGNVARAKVYSSSCGDDFPIAKN